MKTHLVCPPDVDLDDQVPVIICHVFKADISQNACIVEQHMYASELFDGRVDNPVAVLDTVIICDSFAACCSDLIHHHVCGLQIQSAGIINAEC